MRPSPRIRRLNSDYRSVCQLRDESTIFSFECSGKPPQKYDLLFTGAGFYRDPKSGKIAVRHQHRVSVDLIASYPRMMPGLAWQTPIFHPNISTNGVVCMGGYGSNWVPSLTLDEMITMLWDMIRYKNFDSNSPYNREAAAWVQQQSDFEFPIDTRSIRDRVSCQTNQNRTLKPTNETKPLKKRKASPWGILSRLVSTEPPLQTQPIQTEVPVATIVTEDEVEFMPVDEVTPVEDGIHIIEATVVDPQTNDGSNTQPSSSETTSNEPADEGIVFLS
ncbi:ubiquitin-conjugating enzyme E2 [Mariniblastus sp.]|nr:ubiquitin-conjugating enzyme E2 [Mariniblastus sp.]